MHRAWAGRDVSLRAPSCDWEPHGHPLKTAKVTCSSDRGLYVLPRIRVGREKRPGVTVQPLGRGIHMQQGRIRPWRRLPMVHLRPPTAKPGHTARLGGNPRKIPNVCSVWTTLWSPRVAQKSFPTRPSDENRDPTAYGNTHQMTLSRPLTRRP